MLAFIFRGFFLIGVISWYSTSVWKMIDVYFKNRFESYLRAEYDKNPHMLADVEAYKAAAGKESLAAPMAEPEEHLNEVVRACSADVCLASKADDPTRKAVTTANKEATFDDGNNIVERKTMKATESPLVIGGNGITKVDKSPEAHSERLKNDSAKKGNVGKKKTRRKAAADKVEEGKAPKKKLKTITLTEKDFASTRIKVSPQDFAEFDVDEDAVQDVEDESASVLISELPFKPKADIGDLRKVSPEEFCPITLEEEFSCDETETWP